MPRTRQAKVTHSTMTTLTEQTFRIKSDESLEGAHRALLPLADREGFEIESEDGVLTIEFDAPHATKFVVSPNAPMRQVWVSAMAKGYKLSWDAALNDFALDGETLPRLLERLTRGFLGLT
jgi:CyaY protein